jgi:hypothetical protein
MADLQIAQAGTIVVERDAPADLRLAHETLIVVENAAPSDLRVGAELVIVVQPYVTLRPTMQVIWFL